MRKPRSDGVATRAAILEAAADEFAEKGYELASARAVCARAGVNAALSSRYFGTKEDLYRTTAKSLFGDLGAPLAVLPEKVRDAATWKAAIREWVDGFLFMALPTAKPQRMQCWMGCNLKYATCLATAQETLIAIEVGIIAAGVLYVGGLLLPALLL